MTDTSSPVVSTSARAAAGFARRARPPAAALVACVCLLALASLVPVAVAGPAAPDEGDRRSPGEAANATAPADAADLRTVDPGEIRAGTVDPGDPTRDNPRGNAHSGTWHYEPVAFEGEAGEVVHASTYSAVDASVVLLDPRGERVADNEDGGPGDDAELLVRLPENGTYTLQVTSHYPARTFDYALELHRHEAPLDLAAIDVGERRIGTVDPEDDPSERFGGVRESVALSGRAGQSVTVAATAWVDSAVTLRAPDGEVLARDVAPSSGRDARLDATLPTNGTYAVEVASGDGDARFAYQLSVVPGGANASARADHGGRVEASDDPRAGPAVSAGSRTDRSLADRHETTDVGPAVTPVDVVANRTVVRPGEPVALSALVANRGGERGRLRDTLTVGDERRSAAVGVASFSVARATATVSVADPGRHRIAFANETVGTLTVVDPDRAADGGVPVGDRTVIGMPQEAAPEASPSVAVAPRDPPGPATFTEVTLDPASEPRPWFEASQRGTPPGDAPAVASATNATYLSLSAVDRGSVADPATTVEAATVTVDVDPDAVDEPAGVAVYQFDDGAGAWRRAHTELIGETADSLTYRATVDRPTPLAVGASDLSVVRSATLEPRPDGEGAAVVQLQLANDGAAPVERTLALSVSNRSESSPAAATPTTAADPTMDATPPADATPPGDGPGTDLVATETVALAPGETAQRTLAVPSLDAGEYRLSVNGESAGTVAVGSDLGSDGAATGVGGPGLGPLVLSGCVALLGALGASVAVRRWRG